MKSINWKIKLSSRKFWSAVVAFITSIMTAFNVTDLQVSQVTIIVTGIGALCVYMLAEGMSDKARVAEDNNTTEE